jgi:hypothetical protein
LRRAVRHGRCRPARSPAAPTAPLDPTVDFPSTIDDLLLWLNRAGLEPAVRWAAGDLVVIDAIKNKAARAAFD